VFSRLIETLRARGPLDRTSSEVAELLYAGACEWPSSRPLVARAGGYTRTCAYRNSGFEIVLLNWAPGASSAIHDHGDQHCWMLVLEGRLDVDDYLRLDPADVPGYAQVELCGSRGLEPGGMDLRSGRFDLHRVAARGSRSAISLHLYAEPLREFFIYDERARRCEVARSTFDDVLSRYAERVR
jgi:hypothetical protein